MAMTESKRQPVLFMSHGGGPMPLLNDPGHKELIQVYQQISASLQKPDAIIVISAHWESDVFSLASHTSPKMIYDYSGFPKQSYDIQYPASGFPALAERIYNALAEREIKAKLDTQRGFDHGVFVPLTLLFPNADIPVLPISLHRGLDPLTHIELGQVLSQFREENVLILGSGMSFHNLPMFFLADTEKAQNASQTFQSWLDHTLGPNLNEAKRHQALIDWQLAPYARESHPREEHLLPLHVCYGATGRQVSQTFKADMMGITTRCYLWD